MPKTRRIPLSPFSKGYYAVVDTRDYAWLRRWKWTYSEHSTNHYAIRKERIHKSYRTILMHREIMNITGTQKLADHINGNGLDNRRENLRPCNPQQNSMNRRPNRKKESRFKGVTWNRSKHRWNAVIQCGSKINRIGTFRYEIEAARAYNAKAKELFGEFAWLNDV